jgi:hypothetical protein
MKRLTCHLRELSEERKRREPLGRILERRGRMSEGLEAWAHSWEEEGTQDLERALAWRRCTCEGQGCHS